MKGSVIDCENQALGEMLPLGGTPYSLRYRSDRMPGYTDGRELTIPLSDSIAPALKRIEVYITVAGRLFADTVAPAPNLKYHFQWDGKDAYGREVSGEWPVLITVSDIYPTAYIVPQWTCVNGQLTVAPPPLFGLTVGQECQWVDAGYTSQVLMTDAPLTSVFNTTLTTYPALGSPASRLSSLGGWTLNVHHAYDPAIRMLYKGDGLQRSAEQLSRVTTTAAGTGAEGYAGDGGPAVKAQLRAPQPLAVGPDGTVYVAEWRGTNIRRIAPNGIITLFAGGYGSGSTVTTQADAGDGGPATSAKFKNINDLAVGPDGSVYVADNAVVRRIGPDGIIATVAGAYGRAATAATGDGGLATAATFTSIVGVDVGPDGSVYIADANSRPGVRKVSPDGILTTVTGGRAYAAAGACNVDGIAATAACLNGLLRVRLGGDGSVYLLESSRIRRVTPDGLIRIVAGNPLPSTGSFSDSLVIGEPAIGPTRRVQGFYMDVGLDGAVYTNDTDRPRVLRIGTDGIVTGLAGNSQYRDAFTGNLEVREGAPATAEPIDQYAGIAVAPDGSVYLGDPTTLRVHHISAPLPGVGTSEFFIASEDGMERYVFSVSGKHLRTLSTLTGNPTVSFGYGADGQLASVTDQYGLTTRVERDGSGNVATVVGPYGQMTHLRVNADGLLADVVNAAGDTTKLGYAAGGLLASIKEPATGDHIFTYTPGGRLLRDREPDGAYKELSRSEGDSSVTAVLTDALGQKTTYTTDDLAADAVRRSTIGPDGLATVKIDRADAVTTTAAPTGEITEVVAGPDPRFAMQAPLDARVTTQLPSGLTSITTATQTAVLDDPANPATLRLLIDSIQVNGNLFTRTIDWTQREVTELSPEGRATRSLFDSLGRVVAFQSAGLATITTTFDSAGRLATTSQGGRTVQWVYGADGRLARSVAPLGRVRSYSYDPVGRMLSTQTSTGDTTRYAYDAAGRRTGVTLPGGQQYGYSYDSAGHLQSYSAPAVDGHVAMGRYSYDLAGRRTSFTRPDSSIVGFLYDSTGRMTKVTHADGEVAVAYYAASGLPKRLSTNGDADAITFAYDGPLVTSAHVTGLVTGTVGFGYDADRRINSLTVNGQSLYIQHDRDGLLSQVGGLTLHRSAQTGVLLGTTLLSVSTRAAVDSFGTPLADSAWAGQHQLYAYELTRDSLQRVTAKREMVDGVEVGYTYTYDDAGRLHEVRCDGVIVAVYEYDANGNRTRKIGAGGIVEGTYNARDRLITYGNAQYTFGASGELKTKTNGIDSTVYRYDALGNLLSVALPDGRRIDYVVDAMSRRIARKVNGVVVQRFLYGDGPNPLAEVDAAGSITTRYIYGARSNVPAYMERGGATYRVLTDHLGSVRLVVEASSGVVVQRLDYDEFGRVVADSNPGFQPFGYAGGLYDVDTKLVRFGARDYDAETGRWTAEDPLGLQGGEENLYAYVSNAPLNAIDPRGLEVECTYSQSTGSFACITEEGNEGLSYTGGYSGRGDGWNNPDKEGVDKTGPIPRGKYTIEDCYTGETAKYGPKGSLGQPVLSLTPDDNNTMAGREGGFLIHGDTPKFDNTASKGCIILPQTVRAWIQAHGGGDLEVVR